MKVQKIRPKHARYYDLIHVPHGHIPAPLTNLWSNLPIPIKEKRDWDFYYCPCCGEPSFFKIHFACWQCQDDFEEFGAWDLEKRMRHRYYRKRRRDYFRNVFKRLEYLFLPILILLGKAWYVWSMRRRRDC